jgi:hypothetical protein
MDTAMKQETTKRAVLELVNMVLCDKTVRQNLLTLLWSLYQVGAAEVKCTWVGVRARVLDMGGWVGGE